jgi:hypothetical protein
MPNLRSLSDNLLIRLAEPGSHALTENLFFRSLGLIYMSAFGSLLPQIIPLLGSHGIVPTARFLDSMRPEMHPSLVFSLPTLFWLSAADWALRAACVVGCLASVLLIVRWQSRAGAVVCWGL